MPKSQLAGLFATLLLFATGVYASDDNPASAGDTSAGDSSSAAVNTVVVELAQGLSPEQAARNALQAGIPAVEVAASLVQTGMEIEEVIDALVAAGISDQQMVLVLSNMPATAVGWFDEGQNERRFGRPFGLPPTFARSFFCTNPAIAMKLGNTQAYIDRCGSPS